MLAGKDPNCPRTAGRIAALRNNRVEYFQKNVANGITTFEDETIRGLLEQPGVLRAEAAGRGGVGLMFSFPSLCYMYGRLHRRPLDAERERRPDPHGAPQPSPRRPLDNVS